MKHMSLLSGAANIRFMFSINVNVSYANRLWRHFVQLRYVKWKVSVARPLVRSMCPLVKTPKSFILRAALAMTHVSSQEWVYRNKATVFFFRLPCIDTLHLYQNEGGGRDISRSESRAAAAADAASAILLGHKVELFIGARPCSRHCICWQKIYRQTLIHLWLLLIICPNDLSIKRRPSR